MHQDVGLDLGMLLRLHVLLLRVLLRRALRQGLLRRRLRLRRCDRSGPSSSPPPPRSLCVLRGESATAPSEG